MACEDVPQKSYIFIVMSNGILFGAYKSERQNVAYAHARTILGAEVVACELLEALPESVQDDINIDEYDEAEDTPVVSIPLHHIKDKP